MKEIDSRDVKRNEIEEEQNEIIEPIIEKIEPHKNNVQILDQS
jgi:hypothetical protein